ncbi:MAG TPA: amidohydrolase family protein [Acidimicrobiales bacterium]|nr:amidohydrolase family protein [Acidimicrobiales bacterium]
MAHDLIIRGGSVLDGTGARAVAADVAVDGDRIKAVGDLSDATADRELDASGLTVTPGFVDLHTHFDAQVGWDPLMTSASWHGVTTAVIGNCGMSFAPVDAGDEAYLAEMMESVEDIPRDAILGGLPWSWSSHPQYLDAVQALSPALNVVGLVGHCAVRYQVMGERSLDEEVPTPDELGRMRDVVAESIAGGAVGYSTSRILVHRVPDGRAVPGTFATNDEHLALADGMNDAGGGLFQVVCDFESRAGNEFQLLRAMAEHAGDVLFAVGPGNDESMGTGVVDLWGGFLADANTVGRATGYTMTRPSGSLMGLAQVPPVKGGRWREVMTLPTLEDRLDALRDDATRAELVAEGREKGLIHDPRHIHPLGTGPYPAYDLEGGSSIADLAEAAGVDPVELVIDRLLESEGRELFNLWFFHRNRSAIRPLIALDHVYPGAGDAGAHAGQICDADAATHFLAHWSRDEGLLPFAEAVHRLTGGAAATLGLVDRGTIRPGAFADLNVLDPAGLRFCYPEYVNDFPGGAGRLRVRAEGYAATLVNGTVVTEHGDHTGARPGRVLREFARG